MKLVIACLLAGVALSSVRPSTTAIAAPSVPAPKEWCSVVGTLNTITSIKPTLSGSVDTISQCKVAGGISVSVDFAEAKGKKDETGSTFSLTDSTVGARTTVAIRGPEDQSVAKELAPFHITVHNNKFGQDGQLFISGAFPVASQIAVTGNSYSVNRPLDNRFPGGFLNTTAIAIAVGEVYLWEDAALRIVNNEIKMKDSKGRFELHGISLREHMYWYGQNSTFEVAHNNINVQCDPSLFNNTLCGFGVHGTHTMHMYSKDSRFLIDNNHLNVTGGLLWKMPHFTSHLASSRISTSGNKGFSFSEKNPSSCLVRRYAPFAEYGIMNMGAQSYLDVNDNVIECKGKSGILGFATDLTATDHVFISIRNNQLNTRGCSPSIYFMNTFALSQKAILWIDSNVHSRADLLTSGLASIYFAGEFSVQHDAEFTVSRNTFGRARTIKPKTKMVGLAPSAINSWKVEEQASIHMCGNTYNGIDVSEEDELKPHIALKMQEVVICDECRSERRPYSDDFEPGGADDVTVEYADFGEDQSTEYTKAVIEEHKPELDTENMLEGEEELLAAAAAAEAKTKTQQTTEDTEDDTDDGIQEPEAPAAPNVATNSLEGEL